MKCKCIIESLKFHHDRSTDVKLTRAKGSGGAYSMGLKLASVCASICPSTLSNKNISETSWQIVIKFHQKHYWGGGLTALSFGLDFDHSSSFSFDWLVFILAGNKDNHKISDGY